MFHSHVSFSCENQNQKHDSRGGHEVETRRYGDIMHAGASDTPIELVCTFHVIAMATAIVRTSWLDRYGITAPARKDLLVRKNQRRTARQAPGYCSGYALRSVGVACVKCARSRRWRRAVYDRYCCWRHRWCCSCRCCCRCR